MTTSETFMSGALAVNEDSNTFHTASQDLSDSAPQESVLRWTLSETPKLPPSNTHTTLPVDEVAISTALPLSDDEDLELESFGINTIDHDYRRQSQETIGESAIPAVKSYSSTIDTLSLHLPHLVNVTQSSRKANVRVTCYDYCNNEIASVRAFSIKQESKELQSAEEKSLRKYLADPPPERLQLRLIVVNDLSTDIIDCLGNSFSMSPEFYEEHLVNSGWQNGIDNDQEPDTWITRDIKKAHMSLRWYRPVKRTVQRPCLAEDRRKFLDSRAGSIGWMETVSIEGKPHHVEHVLSPATNILRQNWDIKTDVEAVDSTGGFIALEERATMWNKQCGELHVAVLLLDPLPTIQDEMIDATKALRKWGVDSTEPAAKHETVSPSPTEGSEVSEPVADPESGELGEERSEKVRGTSRSRARGVVTNYLGQLFRGSKKNTKRPKRDKEVKTQTPMIRSMFEGLYPRGPALDYDFLMNTKNVAYLAEHLDRTKPTATNLAEWLTQHNHRGAYSVTPTLHLEFLFAIIHNDTMNTLRHMDLALQDIGHLILDDTLIQQRLLHWRLLLERFATELQQLEVSLRRFASFIDTSRSSDGSNAEYPDRRTPSVEKLLEESVSKIKSLHQSTNRSQKSLMANMSIVESKRGIAEAESVTKLTELAFFFIPLTFSASIFSMQVKELNASSVSIAAFFVVAVIITVASYILRLFIRSESFVNFRVKARKDIRQDTKLAPSSPIPSRTFLAWLLRRMGLPTALKAMDSVVSWILKRAFWTVVVGITVVCAGLAAGLWTSHLTMGIKVGITIALPVISITALVVSSVFTR